MAKKRKYYAYLVPSKEKQGITENWSECEKQVKGVAGARYRSFESREAASEWLHSGANYEAKPRAPKPKLVPAIYFDAGTGRGEGVEVSVTDERGRDLLEKALPKSKLNKYGKHLVVHADATNNYGELLAMKYALLIAKKTGDKKIFGDSKLVVDYWSKGRIKRSEVSERTVALSEEVVALREEFEEDGGEVLRISGDYNPADLGFHR